VHQTRRQRAKRRRQAVRVAWVVGVQCFICMIWRQSFTKVLCPMPGTPSPVRLLESLSHLVRAAGAVVMSVYATAFSVRGKGDHSPVTEADEKAEALILAGLAALTPDLPVVAEEAVAAGRVPSVGERFWLVDPLDGTREFIRRNGEFTVNIALIEHGEPCLGVVLAPALGVGGRLFAGGRALGATVEDDFGRRAIRCRAVPATGLTVVASRSHGDAAALDAFLAGRQVASTTSAGSSLKLCLVAAGEADLYPRLGRTMEWDIAAGHAVLSGASVCRVDDGSPLRYGKAGFENPHFFATGLAD
jgi:3'(2'), 5'-bisphosphate nucleotidase